MRKQIWAIVATAVVVAVAACSDTLAPSRLTPSTPRFGNTPIAGAVNTNFYNGGTCSGINGNIYADQFAVGINGNPSELTPTLYYVRVTSPDGSTILGTSLTANYDGATGACLQLWSLVYNPDGVTQGFLATPNPGGEYKVLISPDPDFLSAETKSDNFKIRRYSTPCPEGETCEEPVDAAFSVLKFYDHNADGVKNGTDQYLDNWKFDLTLDLVASVQMTPYNDLLPLGTSYIAAERMPIETNWVQSAPSGNTFSGTISESTPTLEFGNYCTAPSGGMTLGFWSNPNGKLILNVHWTAWATLVNGGGSYAPSKLWVAKSAKNGTVTTSQYNAPTSGTASAASIDFGNWLTAAQASSNGSALYMLSAQYAAMLLNIQYKSVDPNAFYIPANKTIGQIMTDAAAELNGGPWSSPASVYAAHRDYETKTLIPWLNALNNASGVIPVTPCTYTFAAD
jgi:hypothetical protein